MIISQEHMIKISAAIVPTSRAMARDTVTIQEGLRKV